MAAGSSDIPTVGHIQQGMFRKEEVSSIDKNFTEKNCARFQDWKIERRKSEKGLNGGQGCRWKSPTYGLWTLKFE